MLLTGLCLLLFLKILEEFGVTICDEIEAAWFPSSFNEFLDVHELFHVTVANCCYGLHVLTDGNVTVDLG